MKNIARLSAQYDARIAAIARIIKLREDRRRFIEEIPRV